MLTRQTYQSPDITDVFLGIGVNVLADPELAANEFVTGAGSLAGVYGDNRTPGEFLLDWLAALDGWYDRVLDRGAAALLPFYRRHSSVIGRRVRVYEDGFGFEGGRAGARRIIARGTVEEINDDLSLAIGGIDEPVSAGRLAFEDDCINGDQL
jgi:biotin-(acetyl-CoA carboxylase) ligase